MYWGEASANQNIQRKTVPRDIFGSFSSLVCFVCFFCVSSSGFLPAGANLLPAAATVAVAG